MVDTLHFCTLQLQQQCLRKERKKEGRGNSPAPPTTVTAVAENKKKRSLFTEAESRHAGI